MLALLLLAIAFLASPYLAPFARPLVERIPQLPPPPRDPAPPPALSEAPPPVAPAPQPATPRPPRPAPPPPAPLAATDADDKRPPGDPQPPPDPSLPPPPPPPSRTFVPYKRTEVSRLFNGLQIESHLSTRVGQAASAERAEGASYVGRFELEIAVPQAATRWDQFVGHNPHLPTVLPAGPALLARARVSPLYHALYRRKLDVAQERLLFLERIPSRHNFYDCESILEIDGPKPAARALWIQGEMDVVTDGSDGDRPIPVKTDSSSFQPVTSYRWKPRTKGANPFLAPLRKRMAETKAEFSKKGLSVERNRDLRGQLNDLHRKIYDLTHYSFLVAELDPFIVIPGFMAREQTDPQTDPFAPRIGDFAVVIADDVAYPAIVGDIGPSYKIGEASTRIARAINEHASGLNRAVSDLSITYLVFPQSGPSRPYPAPDLNLWHTRCSELLASAGATNTPLHRWTDLWLAREMARTNAPPALSATNLPPASPATNLTLTNLTATNAAPAPTSPPGP